MKLYIALFYLLIFMLPLFSNQLSVWIIELLTLLGVVLLPLGFFHRKEIFTQNKTQTILFLSLIAILSVSSLFSLNREHSLLIVILYITYFLMYTCTGIFFKTLKQKEAVLLFFVAITSILSLISLYNTIFLHKVTRSLGIISFFNSYYGHNHISALLVFAIPLTMYFFYTAKTPKIRSIFLCVLLLLLTSLFFSFALGSIIALYYALVICILMFKTYFKLQIHLRTILILFSVFSLILFAVVFSHNTFGVKKYPVGSVKERFVFWNQATDNLTKNTKNFIIGSGPDTFYYVNKQSRRTTYLKSEFALNHFVQMLSDTGIIGFFVSLLLLGSVLLKSYKRVKEQTKEKSYLYIAIFVGIVASTINAFTDFDWQLPTISFLFWFLLGLL